MSDNSDNIHGATATIHRPCRAGSIGRIDSWGFGSWANVWDYPTLGLKGVMTTCVYGGIIYPEIQGVRPKFTDRTPYAPCIHWGHWSPTYHLPDGRILVAVLLDGERCFEEQAK